MYKRQGVFDLGLGERGVAVLAPMNRLVAAVHHAAVEHGLEGLDVGGDVYKRQGSALPMSSLAWIMMRRAMNLGSSPASIMRASQYLSLIHI